MADEKRGSDVFTVIGIVTLGFMVLGIAVAVLQLSAYSKLPPRQPRKSTTAADRTRVLPAAGTEGETKTGQPTTEKDSGGADLKAEPDGNADKKAGEAND